MVLTVGDKTQSNLIYTEARDETLKEQTTPLRKYLKAINDRSTMVGFWIMAAVVIWILTKFIYDFT
jgi:hypothetical protein